MFREGQRVYYIGRQPRREGTIRRRVPDGEATWEDGSYIIQVEWDDSYLSKTLSGPLPEPDVDEYSFPHCRIPEYDQFTCGPGHRHWVAPISAIDRLASILR